LDEIQRKSKQTSLNRYGKEHYSKTEEFKQIVSDLHSGVNISERNKPTIQLKYGVDYYSQLPEMKESNRIWMSSDEFKDKSKDYFIKNYGVCQFSQTKEFKDIIKSKSKEILQKIKNTCMKKYGFDSFSKTQEFKNIFNSQVDEIIHKIKITCIERYGVDNVIKVDFIVSKMIETNILRGNYISDELLSEFYVYKKMVRKITNRNKNKLVENWDGYDYYDGEYIKDNFSLKHIDVNYPTIDHKISIFYGFMNDILFEEIGNINNLCFTKRSINSSKGRKIEKEFKI
jgi:hypothetical protein